MKDGHKVDWRKDLALKLINLQKGDGSWSNDSGRWMEKDPVLVTSYSVLTLELIHFSL
jgi:squalene-hopene/tetraprenyl-beta-curcumene cyclase